MSALATASVTENAMEQELQGGIELLQANLAELENSVYHLVRSNVELAQFLAESAGDTDLEQALEENKEILVRKRHRVKLLKKAISELKSQRPHLNESPEIVRGTNANSDNSTGMAPSNDRGDSSLPGSNSGDASVVNISRRTEAMGVDESDTQRGSLGRGEGSTGEGESRGGVIL